MIGCDVCWWQILLQKSAMEGRRNCLDILNLAFVTYSI